MITGKTKKGDTVSRKAYGRLKGRCELLEMRCERQQAENKSLRCKLEQLSEQRALDLQRQADELMKSPEMQAKLQQMVMATPEMMTILDRIHNTDIALGQHGMSEDVIEGAGASAIVPITNGRAVRNTTSAYRTSAAIPLRKIMHKSGMLWFVGESRFGAVRYEIVPGILALGQPPFFLTIASRVGGRKRKREKGLDASRKIIPLRSNSK
jgi:hypothetical protein